MNEKKLIPTYENLKVKPNDVITADVINKIVKTLQDMQSQIECNKIDNDFRLDEIEENIKTIKEKLKME